MKTRKIIATVFVLIALILGFIFYTKLVFPTGIEQYFTSAYYNQFGPLAICIELLIAGYYLFVGHHKANFTMALFGFTAILDPFFNSVGLFTSIVPLYAMIVFLCCALVALFLAFSNTFMPGRISWIGAFISFLMGSAVELFFNYL